MQGFLEGVRFRGEVEYPVDIVEFSRSFLDQIEASVLYVQPGYRNSSPEQVGRVNGYRQFGYGSEGVPVFSCDGDIVGHDLVEEHYCDALDFKTAPDAFFEGLCGTLGNACLYLWKLQGHISGQGEDTYQDQQSQ